MKTRKKSSKSQNKKNKKKSKSNINNSKFKNCENFCKNDYMREMTKKYKKLSISLTNEENQKAFNTCKKVFCNPKCEGFNGFGDKNHQKNFNKAINNGFNNDFSSKQQEMLQKKGALSGCMEVLDYDIFHK